MDRQALADFLKTRRARLQPADVDLLPGMRRRTPGLRREEVAMLAGVSVTWYTWIEQAREVSFSADVLYAIARALRLEPHETRYLFTLAGKHLPDQAAANADEGLTPALRALLDQQSPFPAYVMGRYWHLLGWNQAATEVFGDFTHLKHCNILWYTLVDPAARVRVVDWPGRAQRLVAEFRADCGGHMDDPWLREFITDLQAASTEFAGWWDQHDVLGRDGGTREFDHPALGRLTTQQLTLRLSHTPHTRLVVHVLLDDSRDRLAAHLT